MVVEDFTDAAWVETDPAGKLSQTATRSTWTAITRGTANTYLEKDFGAGAFGLAFTWEFTIEVTACDPGDPSDRDWGQFFRLTNVSPPAGYPLILMTMGQKADDNTQYYCRIQASHDGVPAPYDHTFLAVGTTYYCTLERNNAGKDVTVDIYDAPAKDPGDLVATITVSCADLTDTFRYLNVPSKPLYVGDLTDSITGYMENLDLGMVTADSEDLFAKFIVRHADSQNLFCKFEVGQNWEDLYVKFEVNASADLFAKAVIRNVGARDLFAKFIIRHADSQNLFCKFIVRNIGTQELFAKFMVRQSAAQDLPGLFCVHTDRIAQDFNTWTETDADGNLTHDCNYSNWEHMPRSRLDTHLSIDLGAAGIGEDLIHEFILNVFGVEESPNGALERVCAWAGLIALDDFYNSNDFEVVALIVLATDVQDKYQLQLIEKGGNSQTMATLWVNYQDGYIRIYKLGTELRAYVYQDAAHTILEDMAKITLSADHNFRYIATPLSYGAVGAEDSSGSVDFFFGSFRNLFAKFFVRQAGSANLFAKFVVRHPGSQNLFGKFIVRQAASQNLFCKFYLQRSEDLFGKFVVRHPGSANLYAKLEIQDREDLYCKFDVRHAASQDLFAKFEVRHPDSADLFAKADIRNIGSQNLFGKLIIRQPGSANLFGKFEVRHLGSANLFGKFVVRQPGSINLFGKFIVRQPGSADLFSKAVIRNVGSANLFGKFIIQHYAWATGPYCKFIVRQVGSQDLYCKFHIQYVADLYAKFVVRHYVNSCFILKSGEIWCPDVYCKFTIIPTSADLFSKLEVRNTGAQNLRCKFNVRHVGTPQNLFCKLQIYAPASANLFSKFNLRNTASQNLYCKVRVGIFANLYAKFWVNQGFANLYCKFKCPGPLKSCIEVLAEDDINDWINYYDCQETGFLDNPVHDNDPVIRASGVDSYRIQIDPMPGRYKAIVFGWTGGIPVNTCNEGFYVGGGGYVVAGHVYSDSPPLLKMVSVHGRVRDYSSEIQAIITQSDGQVTFLRMYNGILWIGSNYGHVIGFQNGVFTNYKSELSIGNYRVTSIVYNGSFYLVTSNNENRLLQAWIPGSPSVNLSGSLKTLLENHDPPIYNLPQKWIVGTENTVHPPALGGVVGLTWNHTTNKWFALLLQKHNVIQESVSNDNYLSFPAIFETDGITITVLQLGNREHMQDAYDIDAHKDEDYFLSASSKWQAYGALLKHSGDGLTFNSIPYPPDGRPDVTRINMQFYDYQLLGVSNAEWPALWRRINEKDPTNISCDPALDPDCVDVRWVQGLAQSQRWAMYGGLNGALDAGPILLRDKYAGTSTDFTDIVDIPNILAIAAKRNWDYGG